ncbi:ABC transporter substrate-binding protein [Noviherbaspirillum suwonense]|jgi:branched-chain amino acid transport system substrate-binding protein|uniref:Amino acid/amide ABC transporter substrate-binding protein, HAAT family n=1 Tax=Noviherbaspirillum suwonense TaxID=1224511 RepID=A0ABY1Q7B9_9BURK|nr:ABC transporter substrate-binding protein [Noviherbaspirillum suwonense]SMP61312.1 amino acid/amide ABC transporter substrate-binding protein, HAAT family [Noviherbaspirillum suwonense]
MKKMINLAGLAALSTLALASAGVHAQQTIRMGALTTLEGPFAQAGQDGLRGVELALEEAGYKVAGKKIELIKESSNAKPDVAVARTRKLIEQDKVDFVVGPLSGGEGLAVKDYANTVPGKTFLNGTSGAQDTTLRNPAPNFFRFSTDGAQWQAGLGSYAYDVKKYRNIAVISEDYSFPYSQVMGFQLEYCARGGKIAQKNWVPLGTKDYTSVIARLPQDVDAVYVLLGGSDAVNFFTQYYQSGGKANIIGGSVTVDQNVLSTKGAFRNKMIGLISAGPIADANPDPKWVAFVDAYKKKFPDGFSSPSLFAHGYYVNTKAALLALEQVKGDLSDNQQKFQKALASLTLDSPTGKVVLDENRQAIADNYVTEVVQGSNGSFQNKLVKTAKAVPQSLGLPRDAFLKLGSASRDNPACTAQ